MNAARTETRCSGVRWKAAARTVPQGSSGVTGLSEPKASGTPARSRAAKGLRVRARSRAQPPGVHAVLAAPERVEGGLDGGGEAQFGEGGDGLGGEHLGVLDAVPGGPHAGEADLLGGGAHALDHGGDGGVADGVEARLEAGLGAGDDVRGDRAASR